MKQLTLTTATGTVAYDLAPSAPLPAIKAGCLTFLTRAGVEVSVPAADVLEFAVGTAPRMTKADKMRAALLLSAEGLGEIAASVYDEANGVASADDPSFVTALSEYAEALAAHNDLQERTQRFLARRAETERKRAAGETRPRAKKAAPFAPVETTPAPKAKRAKK